MAKHRDQYTPGCTATGRQRTLGRRGHRPDRRAQCGHRTGAGDCMDTFVVFFGLAWAFFLGHTSPSFPSTIMLCLHTYICINSCLFPIEVGKNYRTPPATPFAWSTSGHKRTPVAITTHLIFQKNKVNVVNIEFIGEVLESSRIRIFLCS